MSQYAVIPIGRVSELQETYDLANPETWKVTKGTTEYGGLEDNIFTNAQKTEITALGGQWFADAEAVSKWINEK